MRTGDLVGRLSREQRDNLRKQIDVRVRERLDALANGGGRPPGHVSKQAKRRERPVASEHAGRATAPTSSA
jgi:hypothetical protein